MSILHLNLKAEYFYQIKLGHKIYEFRLRNDYWTKRLDGREYESIYVKNAYPRKDDWENIEVRPWRGYELYDDFKHEHFGRKPVNVFAIRVN